MSEIQSLARGLRILDAIAQSENGVNLTDVALLLEVDKSTASRLLSTLERYSYVERDTATRRYLIGAQVMALSGSLLARFDLRDVARPFLQDLMDRTHESTILGTVTQGQILYMEWKNPRSTVNLAPEVGTVAPLHATAMGKLALAYRPELPFPTELPPYTENTITDADTLKRDVALIRAQGYSIDREEYIYGVKCISAPVFDHQNRMVGAIGILTAAPKLTDSTAPALTQTVCEIADSFSRRLGYR